MKLFRILRIVSSVFILAAVIATVFSLHYTLAGKADGGTIEVTGTVTDQNGNGINNVSVTATDPGGSTVDYGPVNTTSDGTYALPIDPGEYDLHFTPTNGSGFNPIVDSNLTLNTSQVVNVQLIPTTYTLSGTVYDANGQPASGVQLDYNTSDNSIGGTATSDANGNYSVQLPAGTYSLVEINDSTGFVYSPSSTTNVTDLTSGNATAQPVYLPTMTTVSTLVKDSAGNPVSGANVVYTPSYSTNSTQITVGSTQVTASSQYSAQNGSTNYSTITDTNGLSTFEVPVTTKFSQEDGSTAQAGNICLLATNNTICLPSPLTVSGPTSVILQSETQLQTPSAPTNLQIPSPTTAPSLTWNAVSGATSYNIYANGVLIGNTTATSYTDNSPTIGTDSYYVTAVNSAGESAASNIVNVTVTSPTTAPTFTSPSSVEFNARAVANFTVTTTGSPTPSITESGTLPTGITFTDNGDGTATFAGQASPVNQGYYFITLTATSSAGSVSQNFVLTINNAQTPPTFVSANDLTESYGVPFSFTVDTTGNPLPRITKVSGSGSLPSGVTLKDNSDGTATLSGELTKPSDSGTYSFSLQAKNSNGTATQPFTLVITKTPVITTVPTKTATVGTAYSQTISATGDPTPSLTVSGLPAGLSFTDNGNGTGTISGTPSTGSGNSYTVTITATNTEGSSTSSFTMKVNEAPTITSSNTATATVGNNFNFQVTSTGFPTPTFNETGALPKGITFKNSTGTFSGTPAAGTAGTYHVTITARNSQGTVEQGFVLTVE